AWGVCQGEVVPVPEVCDDKDNDCNGLVDDGLPSTSCGVGACRMTVPGCAGGELPVCVPGQPSPEICNGIDDNCNGLVDEGSPPGGAPCDTGGLGVCGAGTTTCQSGSFVCNQ